MGKKSKNPKKAKVKKDPNPNFRVIDKILASSSLRDGISSIPHGGDCCLHLKTEVANMDRLSELQAELKNWQGQRVLRSKCEDDQSIVTFWAIKSRCQDGYYRNMLDLVIATAASYLLQYDCCSTNKSSSSAIHKLTQDLIAVACALIETDEGYGMMEEEGKRYKNAFEVIPDLTNQGRT